MGNHQVIYTSCKRGIEGIYDGQQIYSYDTGFSTALYSHVRRFFRFPVVYEDIDSVTQVYSCMQDGDERTAALCTYIGMDYMGDYGRMGNYMSHVVTGDMRSADGDTIYPCELLGGSTFRTSMKPEEVNCDGRPDHLPEPVPARGGRVTVQAVGEFLRRGSRRATYESMLSALLTESDRRIVICGTQENILMWIAALEYAFPAKEAWKIPFTTYEPGVELSFSRICGVSEYLLQSGRVPPDSCCVFSENMSALPPVADMSGYCAFIADLLTTDSRRYAEFMAFADEYDADDIDTDILSVYEMYRILSDKRIAADKLRTMIPFIEKCASADRKAEIADMAIRQGIIEEADAELTAAVIRMAAGSEGSDRGNLIDNLAEKLVWKAIAAFCAADEREFNACSELIADLSHKSKIVLGTELFRAQNADALHTITEKMNRAWQFERLTYHLTEYLDSPTDGVDYLIQDLPQLLEDVVGTAVKTDNAEENIAYAAHGLISYPGYMFVLLDSADKTGADTEAVWRFFTDRCREKRDTEVAAKTLIKSQMWHELGIIYVENMRSCLLDYEAERIFMQYLTAVRSAEETGEQYVRGAYEELFKTFKQICPNDLYRKSGSAIDGALAARKSNTADEAAAVVSALLRIFDTSGCAKVVGAASQTMAARFVREKDAAPISGFMYAVCRSGMPKCVDYAAFGLHKLDRKSLDRINNAVKSLDNRGDISIIWSKIYDMAKKSSLFFMIKRFKF